MSETPDIHQVTRQVAVLEERMKTMQAEYRTDIARLAEDMAKRDASAANRETRLILAMIVIVSVAVGLIAMIVT